MPNAVISELQPGPSPAPAGKTVTLFKNRCVIQGTGSDVFINYELALLEPDGSVTQTLCEERVKQSPGDYSGLSYTPTKREPLRCDPEPLEPDGLSSFDYALPDKDVDILRFGFRVWLSQNGKPSFPPFTSPSAPDNVVLWTISYPGNNRQASADAIGAMMAGGLGGFALIELL